MQVRKHCERIPCLPDYGDTVVGETLPCVAESGNSSDWFAVANLANFPNSPIRRNFSFANKTHYTVYLSHSFSM